jgi:hypothetical protein
MPKRKGAKPPVQTRVSSKVYQPPGKPKPKRPTQGAAKQKGMK